MTRLLMWRSGRSGKTRRRAACLFSKASRLSDGQNEGGIFEEAVFETFWARAAGGRSAVYRWKKRLRAKSRAESGSATGRVADGGDAGDMELDRDQARRHGGGFSRG